MLWVSLGWFFTAILMSIMRALEDEEEAGGKQGYQLRNHLPHLFLFHTLELRVRSHSWTSLHCLKNKNRPGTVAHACNPSTAWPTWWNPISIENTKISQAWWQAPVSQATWEAEAGEMLEPGRQRLQWAKIVPLHSSLGDRERLHLKTKQNRTKNRYILKQMISYLKM